MNQEIDINKILQILGAKEVEISVLREHIQKLEQEKQNGTVPLKTEAVD